MTTTRSVFPTIDAPRPVANSEHRRVILDYLGDLEPYIEEPDSFSSMPVRLVHDASAGFRLEFGPYSLSGKDIEVLRAALASYDEATATAEPQQENATSSTLLDVLKYVQGEVSVLIEVAQDRLGMLDVDDALADDVEHIQELLSSACRTLFEETAPFREGTDPDHYSDGRKIETNVQFGNGMSFTYRAHPQPDHRINRPEVVLERVAVALAK